MAQGRCAGCGRTGECRAVQEHVMECPDWLRLYREDSARALPPAQELERWKAGDQQAERIVRLDTQIQATDDRRAAGTARFARRKDPLDD